ncbi:hypothetical protein IFM89_014256 [Coptis chinensis]|uniref:Cyanobacterial aminoacyl-tRNA synthetase CAAD domain-containing protein n=1 Tax=Coptis chinensis TaxID=261450 RepID=A0A835IKN8_9MAGN|nr:hypothetical protein IFM89_014256 [Coptis chinensis]
MWISWYLSGLLNLTIPLLRATSSEENSTGVNVYFEDVPSVAVTKEESSDDQNAQSETTSVVVPKDESYSTEVNGQVEDANGVVSSDEQTTPGDTPEVVPKDPYSTEVDGQLENISGVVVTMEGPDEQNAPGETTSVVVQKEESPAGEQFQISEFLEKLNLKLDSEDTYSVLIYGTGALVALWLASAVIGAIDSIPLVPKVLEIVGLSYTIWFTSRYLIFKKNRDELLTKIEEVKHQITGSTSE